MLASNRSLIHALHRASQVAEQKLGEELNGSNLTPRQIVVLDVIENAGKPVSQTYIARATGIDRSTVSEMVRRLQQNGLVSRRRSKEDVRVYMVSITADGERLVKAARPALERVEEQMLQLLPQSQRSALQKALAMLGDRNVE